MSNTISIRDIKSGLPTLTGPSNFRRWYNTWYVSLRGAGLWSVVDDGDKKESHPSVKADSTDDLEARRRDYDKRNDTAHALIVSGVCEDLQDLVSSVADETESARVAMRLLKTKFDHETTTSTLNLFTSFLDLKMNDGDDLSNHISIFDTSFQHILSRCAQSKRPEAKGLKDFLAVEEVRIMCLFRSLPSSMENIVDNLSTKENPKYADVSAHLLDLISKKASTNNSTSKAYFVGNDDLPEKGKQTEKKECSWCKKHGFYFKNHNHRDCKRLRATKEKEGNNRTKAYPRSSANTVSAPNKGSQDCDNCSHIISEKVFSTSISRTSPSNWILDSGCSTHMTSRKDLFSSIESQRGTVTVASGKEITAHGRGTVHLDLLTSSGKRVAAKLENVLYVPDLIGGNLISEGTLERKGFEIVSKNGNRRIFQDGKEWMHAVLDDMGHFVVKEHNNKASFVSYMDAHNCFGHPGQNAMHNLKVKYPSLIPKRPDDFHCPSCILSKLTHFSSKTIDKRTEKPCEIIHSDLSGKFSVESIGAKRYYITFIDDFSRHAWVTFLRNKNDTFTTIRTFVDRIQNQYGVTIKKFFSDNGGEYIDERIENFMGECGIDLLKSPAYEPESNGVAERFNKTIVTKARTMLLDFPKFLWAESIATAVYLYNRTPHRTIEYRSPLEVLENVPPPTITHLHKFGSKVFVHIPAEARPSGSKLSPTAIEGNFVGYTNSNKIFRIYIPSKRSVLVTRQVHFPVAKTGEVTLDLLQPSNNKPPPNQDLSPSSDSDNPHSLENDAVQSQAPRQTLIPGPFIETDDMSQNPSPQTPADLSIEPLAPRDAHPERHDELDSLPIPLRRATRERRQADPGPGMVPSTQRYRANVVMVEPLTFKHATQAIDSERWKNAIEEEMDALHRNKTWDVVPIPKDRNVVGSKWVFKIKHKADGSIERYKARLVAKGFSQQPGTDYDETYAPVARFDSLRLLLALAAHKG